MTFSPRQSERPLSRAERDIFDATFFTPVGFGKTLSKTRIITSKEPVRVNTAVNPINHWHPSGALYRIFQLGTVKLRCAKSRREIYPSPDLLTLPELQLGDTSPKLRDLDDDDFTNMTVTPKSTFRDKAAANPNLTETEILNSGNIFEAPADKSDVTVVGAGIHGLIYAIHARKVNPDADLKIAVFEKAARPQWKIGESTLPHFAQWTKSAGMAAEYLLRVFGLHNGLDFYVLDREHQPAYKEFCNNGPPPFFAPGYQLQRSMSELVFTVFAQRLGVNVWHGHGADVQNTVLSQEGNSIPIIRSVDKTQQVVTKSRLVVDGTGRFRQYASKAARVKRFEGWNTDAFFGYFECNDEPGISKLLPHFEGGNTNHIVFPEGWMYLIRMLSWHGSPMPNLMDMIHYLLDHAAAGTPNDEIPSTYELAEMFGCKVKWIWSIGYLTRDDITYPADLEKYGSCEAERRFNYFTQKYQKLDQVMKLFTLLPDYHGPGTTWFIRKQLAYHSQVFSGPGWVTIGDGVGFTNALLSPGINVGMASSTYAAQLTVDAIKTRTEEETAKVWKRYDEYCQIAIPSLHKMNKFLYLCFLHPLLPPRVGLLWNIVTGHALPKYSLPMRAFGVTLDEFAEYAIHWFWGSQVDDYVRVADHTIRLLESHPVDEPLPQETADAVVAFSEKVKEEAVNAGRYMCFPFRYEGEFRNYGPRLEWDETRYVTQDIFETQCRACGTWHTCRGDWRKCYTCGVIRPLEDCEIKWRPPLGEFELSKFAMLAPSPESVGQCLVDYVAKMKQKDGIIPTSKQKKEGAPAINAPVMVTA
ncbi:putative tryptophan halogenase [Lyophyllum shimeji]|uniref:Tryptophan halogenase n=1 Tax=Lyophyllum shimeji TaxID=47721 RepID=A0A9P3UUJ1_LYOSH|nr:putative tryptophan halogenase [Lyophyllum shimeji]